MKLVDKPLRLLLRTACDRLTREDDAIAIQDPTAILVLIANDGNMGSASSPMLYLDALLKDASLYDRPVETDMCAPQLSHDVRQHRRAGRSEEPKQTVQQFWRRSLIGRTTTKVLAIA
jgi:hypothetical protein